MKKYTYVLKAVRENFAAFYDTSFIYPKRGLVTCHDWIPDAGCGNGLHGFEGGVGDTSYISQYIPSTWLVIRVDRKDIIRFGDKCKFKQGNVIFDGSVHEAAIKLESLGYTHGVIGRVKSSGLRYDYVYGGDYSDILAGSDSHVVVGKKSKVTALDRSTITAGQASTVVCGAYSTVFLTGPNCTVLAGLGSNLFFSDSYSQTFTGGKAHIGDRTLRLTPGVKYRYSNGSIKATKCT